MPGTEKLPEISDLDKEGLLRTIHWTAGGMWSQGKIDSSLARRLFPTAKDEEAQRALHDFQAAAWNLVAALIAESAKTGGEKSYRSIATGLLLNLPGWANYPKQNLQRQPPGESASVRALLLDPG